jgi:hypothetical protein
LVLVEGRTEEELVTEVLQPYLTDRCSLWLTPTVVNTSIVKDGPNFKGGVTSYGQVERDLRKLLRDTSAVVVTTLFDYYALPTDFPGMADRPAAAPRQRVQHVQSAFAASIDDPRFAPFLMLHELEALLFCDLSDSRAWIYQGGDLAQLREVRAQVHSPEDINEGYSTAPSRRVRAAFPGYQKTLHGPMAIADIGLDTIRGQCPHFDAWLSALEAL